MKKKCSECGFEADDKEYEFIDQTSNKDGYSITLCRNCYDGL